MDGLSLIKQKIKNKQQFREKDLITAQDVIMSEYGWIPIKEFRDLPIPTLLNLIEAINKRKKKEQESYKKSRRR